MKRVLILASVASMIDQFNIPNIKLLIEMGCKVDVACNFACGSTCTGEVVGKLKKTLNEMGVECFQIDFSRNVYKIFSDINAYRQVKNLLTENRYDFIHCHSPIGGIVGRLAGRVTGTKVIYTAHGFHFFKGAPLVNWLIYYPLEKICAHFTDTLICINREDYNLALRKMKAQKIEYLPGIGIDLEKYNDVCGDGSKRKELAVPDGMKWVISVGELIKRKNQEPLIRAVAKTENVYLTIAGKGPLYDKYVKLIHNLGVGDRVKLLGFRTDLDSIRCDADAFFFPSFQEGLSVALLEAMASGLPIACSRIRGNTELIDEGKGGFLFNPKSDREISDALIKILDTENEFGRYNREKVTEFSLDKVMKITKRIYENV